LLVLTKEDPMRKLLFIAAAVGALAAPAMAEEVGGDSPPFGIQCQSS
jgi:hypothetical protein